MVHLSIPSSDSLISFEALLDHHLMTGQVSRTICSKCKGDDICFGKVRFHALPPLLVVVINRTTWNREEQKIVKNCSRVVFSTEKFQLNASTKTESFELQSVVEHVGTQATSGHYRAYRLKNREWLSLNDTCVEKIDEVKLVNPSVLVFKKN